MCNRANSLRKRITILALAAAAGPLAAPAPAQAEGIQWTCDGPLSLFGRAMVNAGDVDADGTDDLLVGAPDYDVLGLGTEDGRVFIYNGSTFAVLRIHEAGLQGIHLGAGVAAMGDVNGDGHADYAVGVPDYTNLYASQGSLYVISGKLGGIVWNRIGGAADQRLGRYLAGIGDLDGDGAQELLAGIPSED
jgi:hypothetical protein